MLEVYWGLLIGGAVFVLVSLVFGEILDAFFDGILGFFSIEAGFIHPLTIIGGLTTLGAAGVLLTEYTSLASWTIFLLALCASVVLAVVLYMFYLKPMQQAENSLAYSIQELIGSIVEVSIPVPAQGYGEVVVSKAGTGLTHHIAASWDKRNIEQDTRAVVVDVKDGVLFVSPLDDDNGIRKELN